MGRRRKYINRRLDFSGDIELMIIYETITKEIEDIKDAVARQEELLHEILEALKQKEKDNE